MPSRATRVGAKHCSAQCPAPGMPETAQLAQIRVIFLFMLRKLHAFDSACCIRFVHSQDLWPRKTSPSAWHMHGFWQIKNGNLRLHFFGVIPIFHFWHSRPVACAFNVYANVALSPCSPDPYFCDFCCCSSDGGTANDAQAMQRRNGSKCAHNISILSNKRSSPSDGLEMGWSRFHEWPFNRTAVDKNRKHRSFNAVSTRLTLSLSLARSLAQSAN